MIIFFGVCVFCFGACLGSFANVCIWRLPRPGLTPASPARSLCPKCGFKLPWYDNIPILSWFLLRGSCRCCGESISFRYTIVEFLTALVVCGLGYKFLYRNDLQIIQFALWTLVFGGLIVAAFIDFELMILPDEIMLPLLGILPWFFFFFQDGAGPLGDTLGKALAKSLQNLLGEGITFGGENGGGTGAVIGAVLGFVFFGEYVRHRLRKRTPGEGLLILGPFYLLGAAYGVLIGGTLFNPQGLFVFPGIDFFSSVLGSIAGAALIWIIRFFGQYVFAQEAMGFGDLKLMALLGAMTGLDGVLWTLAFASILGSIIGIIRYILTGDRQLPFGPFLIGGASVVFFAHQELIQVFKWYTSLFVGGTFG